MAQIAKRYDASRWTGDPDRVAPWALAITLAIGVIGFLIVGAVVLTG